MRPIGFPQAVRELLVMEGRPIQVTITDRRGVELASIRGLLAAHPIPGRVEFAVEDPGGTATPLPLSLGESCACAHAGGRVRIATPGEVTVLFAPDGRR